ncbi:hypothetical protein ACSAZL_11100 [Methanosarcina sp. T3]|uniref:hypothetical protein n=1 Tax=Methanosarcina sp. T3 TaxID=3439062 RepID=UPI003F8284F0
MEKINQKRGHFFQKKKLQKRICNSSGNEPGYFILIVILFNFQTEKVPVLSAHVKGRG